MTGEENRLVKTPTLAGVKNIYPLAVFLVGLAFSTLQQRRLVKSS